MILKWTRNPILGWLKVLTGIGALGRIRLGKRWVRLEGNESVFFQEAGERESKRLSLVGVETLILG